jgi:hypothetical protein
MATTNTLSDAAIRKAKPAKSPESCPMAGACTWNCSRTAGSGGA